MFMWLGLPLLILFGLVCVFLASPPTAVSDWFLSKFEVHPILSKDTVTVTLGEMRLDGENKEQIVDYFNKAAYIDRYGFLPDKSGTPLVIDTKKGKNDVRFFVYRYNDHVDVFKEEKKKVLAYRLRSKGLQEHGLTGDVTLMGV